VTKVTTLTEYAQVCALKLDIKQMEAVNQEIYSVNKRLIAKIYCLTDELESTTKENRTLKNDRLFLLIAWSILAVGYFARSFS
jgi:hypothetical protein